MKTLLLAIALITSNLLFSQTEGKYAPHSYSSSTGALKEAKNSIIEITLTTISVKVGDNKPFIYEIVNKTISKQEEEEDYTRYKVKGSNNKIYEFTIGASKLGYFIMYAEASNSYILYYCDKVKEE